ncbi:MAG: tRNA (N(6)-L-threonylcarbamoyladenosine(37)-C(2))-methylthiotransferase MtaB [Bacteroidetes bacterium]|nr:tRNA (N(6)-L-threonylcarbamoyladenosine(37)-C(2))-methylthiotransferase MtaB [Bacteroidota bacterium]
MNSKSIAFHHFGCKVNFAEASALSRQFQEHGFEVKDFHDPADVYVISTCVVTTVAEKKCRAAIRQAHKINPNATIAVIGCFSELKPGELAKMEGVDLVLGHTAKFRLLEELARLYPSDTIAPASHVGNESHSKLPEPSEPASEYHGGLTAPVKPARDAFIPSFSFGDRTRSFLKIQDGCDYYCTYCTIPLARGRSRSDTVENAVKNTREILSNGIREIVLTGVNIGDFGRHQGETFIQLITALDKVEGMNRIRISSIEPDLLTNEIIGFVASSASFLPHFHIPLQSGCNKILKAMHRRYTRELYASRVQKIRELMPGACIAADVIVGFPGETDEDFTDTFDFLSNLAISYLHVFTYSKRENTAAAGMGAPVPEKVKKERSEALHKLSDAKKHQFYLENRGSEAMVLFESDNSQGFMHGFTENYIRVKTGFNPEYVNRILPVKLENLTEDGYLVTVNS